MLTSFGVQKTSDIPPLDEDWWARRERAREVLAAWRHLEEESDLLGEDEPGGPPSNPPQDLVMLLLRMEERMARVEEKLDRALAVKT